VNEDMIYAKFPNAEASCKPCVEKLVEQCRAQSLPPIAPNSLQIACHELKRLLLLVVDS
jgi:hypothetical protein